MTLPVIFLGPTLSHAEAACVLPQANYHAPARQGDVFRAVRGGATVIGLIDGLFLDVPAVWHREILWALTQGVTVLGAASMGALRAAELAPFGMLGIGQVVAAYRQGRFPPFADAFEDDDEVAVVHAPAAVGGAALSDAMVDLRASLAAAEAAALIDAAERDALCAAMKRLHFARRSIAALAAAAASLLPAGRHARLASWLRTNAVSVKRSDASALLHAIAAGVPAPSVTFRMERALVWETFLTQAHDAPLSDDEEAVLDELGLGPAAWRAEARAAVGMLAPAPSAAPPAALPATALDRFRRQRGLLTRAALTDWMQRNAVDPAALERLLQRQAALDAAVDAAPRDRLRRAVLDRLRLEGDYPRLLASAGARAAAGARAPAPTAAEADAALGWYFEACLRTRPPQAIATHAWDCGFVDAAAFRRAVWTAYLRAHAGDPAA